MSKFLRTLKKIDGINQKVILKIEKCNDCPFMKFHQDHCIATCRMYSDIQTNVVDNFVMNYNMNTKQIYDPIPIPEWCLLAETKEQLDFEIKTYVVLDDRILISEDISDRNLPIVIASGVDGKLIFDKNESENNELGITELLPAIITANIFKNNLTADEAYEQAYSEYDDINSTSILKLSQKNNFEICSLCGEEDKSVSRNMNHGMCDECWEVSHNDDERKKQAYINNFRIKRGGSFESYKFNTTVLKTENLKVVITQS